MSYSQHRVPKILIINPNSDREMAEKIDKKAKSFIGESAEVTTLCVPGSNQFISTYEDHAKSLPGMIQLLEENKSRYDAFIIACHADPNLDLMKEIAPYKPVIGIAEASMKIATMLGHSFSVISPTARSVPNKLALIDKYNLRRGLASVRVAEGAASEKSLLDAARKAVSEDHAEVLVLGCAGFAGLDKKIESELHVPVLDGVVCALIIAAGLVRYDVGISKICRYKHA